MRFRAYSHPTLTQYLGGKYSSDPTNVEAALISFLEENDARSVFGVCRACQWSKYMGVVLGQSGFGKSFSLKEYAKFPRVAYVECDVFMGSRDLVKEIKETLGMDVGTGNVTDHR